MQHERVAYAQIADDEGHALRHQTGDERDVPAQRLTGDDHRQAASLAA
jgi:hypothetical protein